LRHLLSLMRLLLPRDPRRGSHLFDEHPMDMESWQIKRSVDRPNIAL
jgi:hypothetical protein